MYSEILRDVLKEYERKRDRAIYEQKLRVKLVHEKVPKIKEIDEDITNRSSNIQGYHSEPR